MSVRVPTSCSGLAPDSTGPESGSETVGNSMHACPIPHCRALRPCALLSILVRCALLVFKAMAWDSALFFAEGGGVVALLDPRSGMLSIASSEREARAVGYPCWMASIWNVHWC